MIDSHCHLGIDDFKEDVEGVLKRATQAGVTNILTVACHYNQMNDLLNIMNAHKNVFGAFGIHPENVLSFNYEKTVEIFQKYPQLKAVGEIGLDYHYNSITKEKQITVFEEQIEIANSFKKPIIIHSRDADEDTALILKKAFHNNLLKQKGVIHCFTGSEELAQIALELGFYISASGVITFKNSQRLREIFKKIPLERLLIETDSPYLAPMPYRGKRNESAYMVETLKTLALLKEVSTSELEKITSQNFHCLFKKGKE